MSKINYVLAKDEDFLHASGKFKYVGKEPYVEIPHIIHGKHITDYSDMFSGKSKIRGIKSTNKNIFNVRNMFCMCKGRYGTLDLSEFDMTGVENAVAMLQEASFREIIWPKDKMPLHLKHINSMFYALKTTTLDLSDFDFSKLTSSYLFMSLLDADYVKFPKEWLINLLETSNLQRCKALTHIDAKFHTEELCWAAVSKDRQHGQYVRVKSKKILMYLGSECSEYVKFYYGD